MSSKRLSRKELKEDIRHDEFQEAVATTYEELRDNARIIGIAAGVIVAIALAIAVGRIYLKQQKVAGNEALTDAMLIYNAPVVETDATPDDKRTPSFSSLDERTSRAREAMADVSGGKTGDIANLLTAALDVQEGKADAARATWEEVLKSHKGNALGIAAERNIIRYDRDNGRAAEVVEDLRKQLDATDNNLPEEVILYELAETLDDMGEADEAQELYQRLLDDYPRSPLAAQARQKTS